MPGEVGGGGVGGEKVEEEKREVKQSSSNGTAVDTAEHQKSHPKPHPPPEDTKPMTNGHDPTLETVARETVVTKDTIVGECIP